MKKFLAYLSMACGVMAISAAANAVPIQWTVSETNFDDGGTLSGSFVYDADSDVYSNIRLKTTTGSKGAGADFRTQCTTAHCLSNKPEIFFIAATNQIDLSNIPILDIQPATPLTNSPGTVDLQFGMAFNCQNPACDTSTGPLRFFDTGKLTGTPYVAPAAPTSVPTISPAGLGLMTLLVLASAWTYRRRRSGY